MYVPWPGCLLLLAAVHFLEVLAWEKSRYCIMVTIVREIQQSASMARLLKSPRAGWG
jgi:hypothetical protein